MQRETTEGSEARVWIGVTKAEQTVDFGLDGAAQVASFDEDLYEPDPDDDWKPGRLVGELNAIYVGTAGRERAVVQVIFRFTEYGARETMTATGSLEYAGGVRTGAMSVTGGTGRFAGRFSEIDVDHRNPHKYTAS